MLAFGALLLALTVAMRLLLPPMPGNIDTHAYKDAGVNLATGQGLTSVFTFGNPSFEPKLFAGYPPGFPLIYGAYASLAGIGAGADSVFNLGSAAILILLSFLLLRRAVAGDSVALVALSLLLLLLLPTRWMLLVDDRPDVVGLCLALAALLLQPRTLVAAAGAALLAGLALLVSPICGALAAAGIALIWSLEPSPRPSFATMLLVGVMGLCLPFGIALAIGSLLDPDYAARLLGYVGSVGPEGEVGTNTGAGAFLKLLRGDVAGWWASFYDQGFNTPHAWARTALLAIALPLASFLLLRARHLLPVGRLLPALALLWATGIFALLIVPWSKLYPAMAAGVLLCASVRALPGALWQAAARWTLLAGLGAMVAVQLPFGALYLYSLAGMTESYERMSTVLAGLPFPDCTGDERVIVQLDPFAYFLFKPLDLAIVPSPHPHASAAELVAASDYVVMSFVGSGDPLMSHRPRWWAAEAGDFELLYRPELPQQPRLLGYALSNSSQTWEVEIWGRKAP